MITFPFNFFFPQTPRKLNALAKTLITTAALAILRKCEDKRLKQRPYSCKCQRTSLLTVPCHTLLSSSLTSELILVKSIFTVLQPAKPQVHLYWASSCNSITELWKIKVSRLQSQTQRTGGHLKWLPKVHLPALGQEIARPTNTAYHTPWRLLRKEDSSASWVTRSEFLALSKIFGRKGDLNPWSRAQQFGCQISSCPNAHIRGVIASTH